jgi:hypothetical protein
MLLYCQQLKKTRYRATTAAQAALPLTIKILSEARSGDPRYSHCSTTLDTQDKIKAATGLAMEERNVKLAGREVRRPEFSRHLTTNRGSRCRPLANWRPGIGILVAGDPAIAPAGFPASGGRAAARWRLSMTASSAGRPISSVASCRHSISSGGGGGGKASDPDFHPA